MVNLGDIAKATGFSKATVSRVLSGDPSFTAKESTRHRVIQVANELGYALRTSRSSIPLTIAVLENFDPSNGPQDSYFSDVREALRERAAENMMSLTFFPDVRALVEAGQDYSGFVSLGPAPLTRDNPGGAARGAAPRACSSTSIPLPRSSTPCAPTCNRPSLKRSMRCASSAGLASVSLAGTDT